MSEEVKTIVVHVVKGTNFGAYTKQYPGVVATGYSIRDVTTCMVEAIKLHFKGMKEDGEEVPEKYRIVWRKKE